MRTSVVEAVFAGVMDAVVLDGLVIPADRDSVMRARMNVVVAGQVAHAREAKAGLIREACLRPVVDVDVGHDVATGLEGLGVAAVQLHALAASESLA